ncbi:MAG TPA: TIR domain-containing protein, partial [Coleofasciculaceae cyanobacterium]
QADYIKQHTQFLVKALEWERHQKQNSYLLTGCKRVQAESWLKVRFINEQSSCEPSDLHCEFICESTKNANNLMTQVFISYAEADKGIREKVGKTLMRHGFTVWGHEVDIKTGIDFQEAIKQGIEEADNIVYLLSPDSLRSQYCQQEIDYALVFKKRIIVLLIEDTELAQAAPYLQVLQYIEFTGHEDEQGYRKSADKLLNELKQDVHYYEDCKILLAKALKWERQNRNRSILLRGHNLEHYQAWLKVAKQRTEHPPLPLQEEFIAESANQPPESSLEAFISYSRADSDFARKLNEALQLQGKTTWFDQESIPPGSDFQQEIYRGIECSDNFLFIISPNSVYSPYCADEVEYATKLNKRFVTILYSDVPAQDLHPELRRVQWIDFNRYGGNLCTNFSELVRTLDTDRDHVKSHTKWSLRALEWEEKGKSADLLLRGSEFLIAQNWLQEAEQSQKQPIATSLQKGFIESSKNAIALAQEEDKHRQAEMLRLQEERTKEAEARLAAQKKSSRRLKLFLASVSTALVAVLLGVAAFREYKKAALSELQAISKSSEVLFASNKSLDALIAALKARQRLQKIGRVDAKTQVQVESALRQAVYGAVEYNRLSGHSDVVYGLALSPDSQMIASASWDKSVKLWNTDGTLLKTLKGHTDEVDGVAFSPDGQMIASVSRDKTVKLWNRDGTLLKTLKGHKDEIDGVAFSPDGQMIASASRDKSVKLWNRDGRLLKTLNGHNEVVWGVAFSPDRKLIASGSWDKTVKLWNRDGTLLKTLKGHTDVVYGVAFSPDSQMIASASKDKTVKLWNRDGRLLKTLNGHSDKVYEVAFSPDGKLIASGSQDKSVKLWNRDGTLIKTLNGHSDRVDRVAFSRDGQMIASGSWDKTVKLWKIDSTLLKTLNGHSDAVYGVAFSPDGKLIASGSWDKTVKLWNRDGTLFKTLNRHSDAVYGVAFSPDAQMIASGSRDKTVKLWNRDGRLLNTLNGHSEVVWGVAFSPDGQIIASGSEDKSVKLWNRDGRLLNTLNGHSDKVDEVAFSPDGKLIASGSRDKSVKLWNRDGTLRKTLNGHTEEVDEVAFSPDGQIIASASKDKSVKLWNRDGRLLNTLDGHSDAVNKVAFSPDGKLIASASKDKSVKLWNRDGKLLTTLNGHSDGVYGVAFSLDGKIVASASQDNTVILWDLDQVLNIDELLAYGCNWVRDYLKNNSEVGKSDRTLCDGIGTRK